MHRGVHVRLVLSSLLSVAVLGAGCTSRPSSPPGDPGLPPPTGAVTGSVAITGEGPGAGVAVSLEGPQLLVTTTGPSGQFAFEALALGTYTVSAAVAWTAEGTRAATVRLTADAPVSVADLVFTPRGALAGSVLLAGLQPQPPVTVTLAGPVTVATTAGADGSYAFAGLPIGIYALSVTDPNTFEGSVATTVTVSRGAAVAPPLRLTPAGTVSGSVTLAGLDPQPALTVTLSGPVIVTTVTGSTGAYAFGPVPVGDYGVSVAVPSTAEGSASAALHVAMGRTVAPDLSLTPLGAISGSVLLAGLGPQAGLAVSFTGPATGAGVTDGAGRYRFGPLAVGTYVVTVTEPYSVQGAASATVAVGLGEVTAPDLQLNPTARVQGRVVLTQTPPRAGLSVLLRNSPGGGLAGFTLTGSDGTYAFGPLLTFGDYTVTTSAPSTAESTVTAPVRIDFGLSVAPDLVLTALGGVEGRVTVGGLGAEGAAVWAQGTNRAALTDGAGAYGLERLPAGAHTLSASRTGADTAAASVEVAYAATTTAHFALQPTTGEPATGQLSGWASLVGRGRQGGITVAVDATALSTVTAADGSWTLTGVPDGVWSLTVSDGVRTEHVPAVLALPGSTGFLLDGDLFPIGEIELQRARRITGNTRARSRATHDGYLLVQDGTDLLSAPLAGGPVVSIASDVQYFEVAPAPTGQHGWVAVYLNDGSVAAVRASGGPALTLPDTWLVAFDPTGEVLLGRGRDDRLWYAALERGDVRAVATGWSRVASPWPAYFQFTDPRTGEEGTVEYATGNVAMWGAFRLCDQQPAAGGGVVVKEGGASPCYGRVLVGAPGAPLVEVAPASAQLLNMRHSVSPDGRYVAVDTVDQAAGLTRALTVAATADGAVIQSEARASFAIWSPDSSHYLWTPDLGISPVHLASSADGTSRTLDGSSRDALFSPDGTSLAFTGPAAVQVVAAADGALLGTVPTGAGWGAPLAFSPDGQHLVVDGSALQSLSLADGAVTFVASLTPGPYYGPTVSADGRFVLFGASDGISAVPTDGGARALLVPAGTSVGVGPFLAPTDAVLFSSSAGYQVIPAEGGVTRDLGTPGPSPFSAPSLAPDGLSVAHLDGAGVLRAMALPAGAPAVVASGVDAYYRREGGLVVEHADGALSVAPPSGTATRVGTGVSAWTDAPGGWVLFQDDANRVFNAVISSGATSLLASDAALGVVRSDRFTLASSGVLHTAPVAGGTLTPHVRAEPALWIPGDIWSWFDDRHAVYVRTNAPRPYRFQNGVYLLTIP